MKYELCVCCLHKDGYTYRKGRTRVFQCEEFEGIRPDTAKRRGSARDESKKESARGQMPQQLASVGHMPSAV